MVLFFLFRCNFFASSPPASYRHLDLGDSTLPLALAMTALMVLMDSFWLLPFFLLTPRCLVFWEYLCYDGLCLFTSKVEGMASCGGLCSMGKLCFGSMSFVSLSPVLSVEIRGLSVRFLWETLVELESLLIRALCLVLFL